jgi:nucleoside-diphosphate-sugar epimerase
MSTAAVSRHRQVLGRSNDDTVYFSFGDVGEQIALAKVPMKILITGIHGFLGAHLEPQALHAGWAVSGIDMDLYRDSHSPNHVAGVRSDFQELQVHDLGGFDAIVHLAAISSDAACDLRPDAAARMNGAAAVRLARLAKDAGARRFVFASSCSVYGSAKNRISTERSRCAPISAYARSKLEAEDGILRQASSTFAPTVLRFATLYGLSPSLRTDLVVNSMVASASIFGEIALHGTGHQSRPLIHVRDAASAVLDVLGASDEEVRGKVFNVTDESTGYSVAQIAMLVRQMVSGSRIVRHPAATDRRHYLVDGTRLNSFRRRPLVRLHDGIAEVAEGFLSADWQRCASAQESNRARRLRHLLDRGELTDDLRWRK